MAPTAVLDKPEIPNALPPIDDDGNWGGDGGRGDGPPPSAPREGPPIDTGRIALYVVLAGIVMLFAGSLSGYLVQRFGSTQWPPPGYPVIPSTLWIGTVVIALSSLTGCLATRAVCRSDKRRTTLWLVATFLLGLGFCLAQALIWRDLWGKGLTAGSNNYAANFYMITVLHVGHVLAGIVFLAWCVVSAWRGKYRANHRNGLDYALIYWHFVGGLWYVLFTAIYLV